MTDTKNPTVAVLRDEFASKGVWSNLSESQQNIIKEVVSLIEATDELLKQQEVALEGTPLAEAHSSANVFMVDPATKANIQFTFRGHTDADVENRVTKFLERTTGKTPSLYWLSQDQYRDENWNNKGNAQPTPKQPQPTVKPTQPATGDGQATETFNADELSATTMNGKVYWGVKGGRYQKYGVRVWPEVLTASGFDVESLDPEQTYSLAGKLAEITFKDDGKTDKVIRFIDVE